MKITKQAIKTEHCPLSPQKTTLKKTQPKPKRERTGHSRRWTADPLNENCQTIHTGNQDVPGSAVLKCLPQMCTYQSDWGNCYPYDPQPCAPAEWGIFLAARRLCFANATFADRAVCKLGGCYWLSTMLLGCWVTKKCSYTDFNGTSITVPWMP